MLANWDPFRDVARVHDEFSRLWGINQQAVAFRPAVDVHEDEKAYTVTVELPGLKPEDIEVELEGGVLTLKGEKRFEQEKDEKGYHVVERSYGSFLRRFSLPDTVDSESIDASTKDGLLTLTLPKTQAPKPKKISVS